jgi:hypothetical protein
MAYRIDCSFAGPYADACKEATTRFQAKYPNLGWEINTGFHRELLTLTVITPGGKPRAVPIQASGNMADSIFNALVETLRFYP